MNNQIEHFFITKILDNNVFCLGDFQLNSGVKSKFYYNFSKMSNAKSLFDLGFVIVSILNESQLHHSHVLVGSAYKGIPLCIAAVNYAFNIGQHNLEWAFDRKEEKRHGEKGDMVGADITGKNIVIIDDVITSGRAMQRTIHFVENHQPASIHCLALIDRRESLEVTKDITYPIITVTHHQKILEKYSQL